MHDAAIHDDARILFGGDVSARLVHREADEAGGGAGCRGWPRPGVDDAAVPCGTVSTVPGRIVFGSWPMARRLAAYRAGQPPCTPSPAAMPDRVSPVATV